MANAMPGYTSDAPGLMAGDEWWQQILSYGLGRKWDSEYLLPFSTARDQQYFKGADGAYYKAGEPIPMNAQQANMNTLIVGGLLLGGAVVLMLLFKD